MRDTSQVDAEQYEALTPEDIDWLRRMGWKPQFEWLRRGDLVDFPFLPLPSIVSIAAPTRAEIRAGIRE